MTHPVTSRAGGVQADYPTSRLTTVGTGGPARWFARPTSVAELGDVLAWAADAGLEIAVIGLGSNLLVADAGYDGVVIRLAGELARIERDGERIVCGGGASLAAIVKRATGWGLSGIEFGCAIPGTAGGAVRMNAGAYGGEIRDVLADALVIGAAGGRRGGPDELGMSYRRSSDRPRARWWPRRCSSCGRAIRPRSARPWRRCSGGGGRRSPPRCGRSARSGRTPAATARPGACSRSATSRATPWAAPASLPVHANFIENHDGARSADVIALMREARRRARERGVELEHEVQMLGPIGLD